MLIKRQWQLRCLALLGSGLAATGLPVVFFEENSTVNAQTSMSEAFSDYTPRLDGMAKVEMIVGGQSIIIELDGKSAPMTAGNFVDLVEKGVYDGLAFHRVVRDPQPFVAQGGDPQPWQRPQQHRDQRPGGGDRS